MNNFLKSVFNFIIWMNTNIFEPLNNGTVRIDAFIGIVGVIIAIVIFVAETMKDNKVETQKKFVLEKTNMKKSMILSVLILTFCIIKEVLPYNSECSDLIKIIFFFIELLLNVLIIWSIWLSIRLFKESIKLNTESKYFYEEYYKYIINRVVCINNKKIRDFTPKEKNKSIKKIIKDNEKLFTFEIDNLDGYVPVKANKNGIFKSYNSRALQTIIDKIDENRINNSKLIIYSKPLFILPLKENDKVNRGVTIAYYKSDITGYDDLLCNTVLLKDNIPYQDDEINLIVSDLFLIAANKEKDFDADNRLYNFFNYLYKNEMYSILNISYEYIRNVFVDSYNDVNKNNELAKFLGMLASLAYSYQDIERYKFVCDYIYYCYREQLDLSNDIRQVSYEFTNNIIRYDYYSVRKNDDSIYYDVLLSNLMNFLFDLIARKEFKAISDIFQNVIFDYNHFIDEEPDQYDIKRIQFSFGFVYGLIILSNKDSFNSGHKKGLDALINNIKTFFVDIYNQNDAILYFKRYYNKHSYIYDVYSRFDFRFEKKEYRNSFSGYVIDDAFIIKEFLYLFKINYSNLENINLELIGRENKYLYQRLLDVIKKEEISKLDSILEIKYDNKSIIELLEELIKQCNSDEKKYIRNHKINKDRVNNFKSGIFEEIKNGNQLTNYLKKCKKYSLSERKGKRLFGFNQLIGRDIFFENVGGIENISKNYGHAILDGISKDYLKKLDSISETVDKDLSKFVEELADNDKYVIITSPSNWRFVNLANFDDKCVRINGKLMDLIKIPKAKDIYIIKKKHLPKVELLKPDIDDSGTILNGIYYNLIDCSTNKNARNEIQKNTKWLEEKGNIEEQEEYLKENCAFKLFISPTVKIVLDSKCYKIVLKEDDE